MKSIHVSLIALFLVTSGCGGSDATQAPEDPSTTTISAESLSKDGDGHEKKTTKIVQVVERTDIVSNLPGAEAQDPDLQNAWGLAFNPAGVAWVSANETGLSGVYDSAGHNVIPSVTIPPPLGGTPPSHPTGQVFNGDPSAFMGDRFIFVTEDGTISGWQGGASAVLRVDNSASTAVYKGVTIAMHRGRPRLYAANFHAGTVEVYDDTYAPVNTHHKFRDDAIPCDFAPFNVQEIEGLLFVTYAKQDADKHDDVKGPGNGFVDVFDPGGRLVSRLIAHDGLNSPWGLARAPKGFGHLAHHLLVGNFGDGVINVYDLELSRWEAHAEHDGVLGLDKRNPLVIDGLWALRFGVDAGGFSSTDLYFTAGPNGEADGVFGELEAVGNKMKRMKKW